MQYRPRAYAVISLIVAASFMASVCSSAIAAERNTPDADSDRLNAVLEQVFSNVPPAGRKASEGLIDQVYARGSIPVIVRLRDNDLPYGFFSDRNRPRSENIASLQGAVLDDMIAQTAADETGLHIKRFSLLPAMALQVDASGLEALLDNPDVIDIVEDIPVPPTLQDSVPLIGADLDGSFGGYTGLGLAVAILDTGVDKNHPFLSGKVVSEACYSSNAPVDGATSVCPGGVLESTVAGSGLPCDLLEQGCDHGTHVAGIAAGSNDTFSGVAKDASVIAIQVFSRFDNIHACEGSSPCVLSYTSDQILGLERVYALRNTYAIASANMSLSGGMFAAPCNADLRKPIIDSLRAANIATVTASGNSGYTNALGTPACIGSAVSVGSTTKMDAVSSFSNSASFLSLLAPGSSIQSSIPGNGYAYWNGTSMAAPHVAGAWAVLKQVKPDASVDEILEALQDTGVPRTDTRIGADNRVKPRIDVQNALSVLNPCDNSADCNDGVFCNGAETCSGGTCLLGAVACTADEVCDEAGGSCVECLHAGQCDAGYACEANVCEEDCNLDIEYKPLLAEKLVGKKKGKKLKLKITGGPGFDPNNAIEVPFGIVKIKPKVKYKKGVLVKNEVQVTVLVPPDTPAGIFEVRMTPCTGLIEIL